MPSFSPARKKAMRIGEQIAHRAKHAQPIQQKKGKFAPN
jgi:hypothetical protein